MFYNIKRYDNDQTSGFRCKDEILIGRYLNEFERDEKFAKLNVVENKSYHNGYVESSYFKVSEDFDNRNYYIYYICDIGTIDEEHAIIIDFDVLLFKEDDDIQSLLESKIRVLDNGQYAIRYKKSKIDLNDLGLIFNKYNLKSSQLFSLLSILNSDVEEHEFFVNIDNYDDDWIDDSLFEMD